MPDKSFTVATYAAGASLAAITLIYVFAPTYFLDGGDQSGSGSGSGVGVGGLLPSSSSSAAARKKGVVGLANPANDCFINSVLQALAGLGDLRLYLIREVHRRSLDDAWVYARAVPPDYSDTDADEDEGVRHDDEKTNGGASKNNNHNSSSSGKKRIPDWKLEGLQGGIVTRGLKEILDALNERPIYKKTITAAPFVRALELAFRQRISRQQQDAQEFLQVVAERLCDEYHAGHRARRFARRKAALAASQGAAAPLNGDLVGERLAELANGNGNGAAAAVAVALDGDGAEGRLEEVEKEKDGALPPLPEGGDAVEGEGHEEEKEEKEEEKAEEKGMEEKKEETRKRGRIEEQVQEEGEEEEEGFPMEGKSESQIECLTCGFKPKPTESTFCTLTLHVPQMSATTLNACFDGMFKTEYIDDFKCEKCRLVHAVGVFEAELRKPGTSEAAREATREAIARLQAAIRTDPERPPADVKLPDARLAPQRRIARHMRVTRFPKILAIHLSRSIFDASQLSQKNSAKVAFPERLPLGGLLSQRRYKLLGLVTHKGSHHSGHYESFRRQNMYPPFANTNTFRVAGVYSKTTSPATTPRLDTGVAAAAREKSTVDNSPQVSSPVSTLEQQQQQQQTLSPTTDAPERNSSSTPSSSLDSITPTSPPSDRRPSARSSLRSLNTLANHTNNTNNTTNRPSSSASVPIPTRRQSKDKDRTETNSLASVRSTLSRITSRPSSSRSAKTPTPAVEPSQQQPPPNGTARPSTSASASASKAPGKQRQRHHQQQHDRWWRISDEKVKEASTRDVLSMQREVYLLFYELDRV